LRLKAITSGLKEKQFTHNFATLPRPCKCGEKKPPLSNRIQTRPPFRVQKRPPLDGGKPCLDGFGCGVVLRHTCASRLFVCNDWPLFKPGNGPFLYRALQSCGIFLGGIWEM
jgi:hypothetical protein